MRGRRDTAKVDASKGFESLREIKVSSSRLMDV